MAGKKITAFVDGGTFQAGDAILVARGADNFKIDGSIIANAVSNLATLTASVATLKASSPAAAVAHSYWRVRFLSSNDANYLSCYGLQFRTDRGVAELVSGGTILEAGTRGGFQASAALDGNDGTRWALDSLSTLPNAYLGYQFAAPKIVREVVIYAPPSETPRNYVVEYSDNGTVWNIVKSVTDQTVWGSTSANATAINLVTGEVLNNGGTVMDPVSASTTTNPTGDTAIKNYDLTKLPKSRRALTRVNSELGRMKVGFMGDSNTAGEGAGLSGAHLYTGAMPRSLPALVAKTLRSNGVPASFANFVGFGGGTNDITYDPRLTFVNMPAVVKALSGSYLKGQDACSFTFAPGEKFNTFVVRHLQLANQGTFKVCIDGNTANPLGTIVVASSPEAMIATTFTIPGDSAVHTVTVFKEGGSGLNFFESIQCYDTNRPKVEIFNMGTCAKTAGDYVENDKPWHRMQAMSTFGLDMLFIQFGINEEIQGSTASYKANMQTIITLAKAAGIEVVLIMHAPHNGGQDQSVVATAIAELSASNNVPWIDFRDVMGPYAAANTAGDWFDTYHPSAQGYSLEARTVAQAIIAL